MFDREIACLDIRLRGQGAAIMDSRNTARIADLHATDVRVNELGID